MTPVTENDPAMEVGMPEHTSPPTRSGPLIVDGSVNSPPRRHTVTRPVRSSSEELDFSVTTSEDAAVDTPPSSDEVNINGNTTREAMNTPDLNPVKRFGDVMHERSFLSLSNHNVQGFGYHGMEGIDVSAATRKVDQERLLVHLTNGLATVGGHHHGFMNGNPITRKPRATNMVDTQQGHPLSAVANGSYAIGHVASLNGGHEWQIQGKKKKKTKKGTKQESHENGFLTTNGEAIPTDESMRKGG